MRRRAGNGCSLARPNRGVLPVVARLAAHLAVLPQDSFALHADALQDGNGGCIAIQDGGLDALQAQGIVRPIHDGKRSVRRQATALVKRVKVIG
ncbi:hypothetical protein G6F22_021756 [Rhizopus arrhizus]|nr:hypothetical protein G6F22_021756 [Rhizopus arrhizus]